MYIQQFAGSLCLVILFFSSFTPTTRREAGANVNKLKLLPLPSYTEKIVIEKKLMESICRVLS